MKQFFAIALALVLTIGLCACGRRPAETMPTTLPTTVPTTTAATAPATHTTLPSMDTTLETNIPDPSVDTSMPDATDILPTDNETTSATDHTTGTETNVK